MGDVFRALADPTRRLILDELTQRDGQTLFELCSRLVMRHGLGSTRQAISQHLDVLEDAGLIEVRREGRYRFHHRNPAPIREAVRRWLPDPDPTPQPPSRLPLPQDPERPDPHPPQDSGP